MSSHKMNRKIKVLHVCIPNAHKSYGDKFANPDASPTPPLLSPLLPLLPSFPTIPAAAGHEKNTHRTPPTPSSSSQRVGEQTQIPPITVSRSEMRRDEKEISLSVMHASLIKRIHLATRTCGHAYIYIRTRTHTHKRRCPYQRKAPLSNTAACRREFNAE